MNIYKVNNNKIYTGSLIDKDYVMVTCLLEGEIIINDIDRFKVDELLKLEGYPKEYLRNMVRLVNANSYKCSVNTDSSITLPKQVIDNFNRDYYTIERRENSIRIHGVRDIYDVKKSI